MPHNDDDPRYYSFHQETSQNLTAPSPRGSYADSALSAMSQQYPPATHQLPSSSSSSHIRSHSSTEQGSLTTEDPRLAVSGAYISHNGFNDAHGAGGNDYYPGHDPPTPATPSQSGWSLPPSHTDPYLSPHLNHRDWMPNSSSASPVAHGLVPGIGYYQWNAQPQQVFDEAFEVDANYVGRPSFSSPGEGSGWSPDGSPQGLGYFHSPTGPPPTPSGANHEELLSPPSAQSTTPSTQGPFSFFHHDPAREAAYQGHGDGVDEVAIKEMLGLESRINSIETDSSGARVDHNQPSSSLRVFEAQGTIRPVQLVADVDAHFPNSPGLKRLALYILDQLWCAQNRDEPAVKPDDLAVTLKLQKRNPKSRFEPFFDEKMWCRVVEANGTRCEHTTSRKDRAVGHARAHFGYKPFACNGKCGKQGCQERYTCSSFRNDHVGRKKNPKRPCTICQKLLTAQNLQRHMKQHGATPSSPQPEEPLRKKAKISILRAFGRK